VAAGEVLMLDVSDTIGLADGVRFERGALVDDIRANRLPANSTAAFVLRRAGTPLGAVADELAGAFAIDQAQARDDVLAFAYRLNRLLLVEVRPGKGRLARFGKWIVVALRLAPGARLPTSAWRRVRVDTGSPLRAVATTLWALRARTLLVFAIALVLALQVAAFSGASSPVSWVVVALAVGLGLAVHEAGHAAALAGVPAAVVLAGSRTFVLHPSLAGVRRRSVAAAGPAAPLLPATVLAMTARPLGSTAVALGACAFGGHALGLTVATGDGRTACTR
jgi:Coenzyme PQQ synthesis protein D (PqqD)